MSFLSYAQNFEDVMLWRALGHIPNGTYVDVGAQHPRIDSVSRAFYERGWRGMHIEPVPAFAAMLRADRPGETVLEAALGERAGTLALNVFADTGLSTAVDSFAQRHQAERGYEVERIEVPLLTMASALESLAGKEVHWLKIDVEGFEEQVLRGWDSVALRPWIIVVEATIPNSPQTDYQGWDPILVAAGYRFVWFDGLNRFYIASEHPELAAAFDRPPNVFDAVEVSGLASWGLCRHALAAGQQQLAGISLRAAELESTLTLRDAELDAMRKSEAEHLAAAAAGASRIAEYEHALAAAAVERCQLQERQRSLEQECAEARAKAEELKHVSYYWWHTADRLTADLDALRNSRSWRISLPLRLASVQARRARNFAARAARWALRQPARLGNRVFGRAAPAGPPAAAAVEAMVTVTPDAKAASPRRLSVRAARVYADLKHAVEESNN